MNKIQQKLTTPKRLISAISFNLRGIYVIFSVRFSIYTEKLYHHNGVPTSPCFNPQLKVFLHQWQSNRESRIYCCSYGPIILLFFYKTKTESQLLANHQIRTMGGGGVLPRAVDTTYRDNLKIFSMFVTNAIEDKRLVQSYCTRRCSCFTIWICKETQFIPRIPIRVSTDSPSRGHKADPGHHIDLLARFAGFSNTAGRGR